MTSTPSAFSQESYYRLVTEEAHSLSGPWKPIPPGELPKDQLGYPVWKVEQGQEHYFRTQLVETSEPDSTEDMRVLLAEARKESQEPLQYAENFFNALKIADRANGLLGGQWADAKIAPFGHYVYDPAINEGKSPAYFELKIIPGDGNSSSLSTREEGWAKILPVESSRSTGCGYIMISLGNHREPVVEYSPCGKTPVEELAAKISEAKFMPMRFGAGFLAAESYSGKLLGGLGVPPRLKMGAAPQTETARRSRTSSEDGKVVTDPAGNPIGHDSYESMKSEWLATEYLGDMRMRQSAEAKIAWDAVGAKLNTALKILPGQSADVMVGQDVELLSLGGREYGAKILVSKLRNGGLKIKVESDAEPGTAVARLKVKLARGYQYVNLPLAIGQAKLHFEPTSCVNGTFFGEEVEICENESGLCITQLGEGKNLVLCEFSAAGDHFPVYAPATPSRLACVHLGRGVAAWSSLLAWWDRNQFATNAFGYNDLADAPHWGNDERVDELQLKIFELTGSECPNASNGNQLSLGSGVTLTTSMHRALDLFPTRLQTTRVGFEYSDVTSTSPGEAAELAEQALRDGRPAIVAEDDSRYWLVSRVLSVHDKRLLFGKQAHFWASMGTTSANGSHVVYSKFLSASELIFACDAKFWNRN